MLTTIIASILGTAASLALYRYDFAGKKFLEAMLLPPIAIPWLIAGTAMLIFFLGVGIGRGLHAIIIVLSMALMLLAARFYKLGGEK